MKSKPIIIGIILILLLSSIIPMASSIESQTSNIINTDDEDTDYARINDNGSIICSNNYYLFCNLSINGHVVYAKNQIGIIGNKLDIWFYSYSEDVTGWDYGFVSIEGILRSHDFRYALVVEIYGFNGNISWENFVEDVDILVEGSAFLVRVAYHGRPS